MAYNIMPADQRDIQRIAEITVDSIIQDDLDRPAGTIPYEMVTVPALDTPAGRALFVARWVEMGDSKSDLGQFLKAVDPKTGDILGCVSFSHYSEPPKELPTQRHNDSRTLELMPSEADRDYAYHLRVEYKHACLRMYAGLQGPFTKINALCVDPYIQRSGIGTMLVERVIRDNAGKGPVVLMSNPNAVPFYERASLGFRVFEDVQFQVPEKWQDRPKVRLVSMTREN